MTFRQNNNFSRSSNFRGHRRAEYRTFTSFNPAQGRALPRPGYLHSFPGRGWQVPRASGRGPSRGFPFTRKFLRKSAVPTLFSWSSASDQDTSARAEPLKRRNVPAL
ncbi:unnamed protein product [Pieris brassicae]|uniref:Uncharacterized protein n=1 Tax=Pieris brassicae TaxID=7116 RepID=A0A9P0XH95_PIEBR|nr:unnamed protein product [Pieris brassicae]